MPKYLSVIIDIVYPWRSVNIPFIEPIDRPADWVLFSILSQHRIIYLSKYKFKWLFAIYYSSKRHENMNIGVFYFVFDSFVQSKTYKSHISHHSHTTCLSLIEFYHHHQHHHYHCRRRGRCRISPTHTSRARACVYVCSIRCGLLRKNHALSINCLIWTICDWCVNTQNTRQYPRFCTWIVIVLRTKYIYMAVKVAWYWRLLHKRSAIVRIETAYRIISTPSWIRDFALYHFISLGFYSFVRPYVGSPRRVPEE